MTAKYTELISARVEPAALLVESFPSDSAFSSLKKPVIGGVPTFMIGKV